MANSESNGGLFYLNGMKRGMYMCWNIVTQCWNDVHVVIKDDKTTYVDVTKPFMHSGDVYKLSQDGAIIQGDNLIIEISSSKSKIYSHSSNSGMIYDNQGNMIGCETNICLEDNDGSEDFNDVYINFVAWNTKG